MKIEEIGKSRRLFCLTCTRFNDCKILKKLRKIKRGIIQTTLDNLNINKIRNLKLKILEGQRRKCLNRRRYLHLFKPKYVCFRDAKYEIDDEYLRHVYCGREKEWLFTHRHDIENSISSYIK